MFIQILINICNGVFCVSGSGGFINCKLINIVKYYVVQKCSIYEWVCLIILNKIMESVSFGIKNGGLKM